LILGSKQPNFLVFLAFAPSIRAILTEVRMHVAEANALSAEVRRSCESHLGARHAAEALLRCWGSGAGLMLNETKASIKSLLAEYKVSLASLDCELQT
jgi:hypothetical protein